MPTDTGGAIRSVPDDFRSRLGEDSARRIVCEANWQVVPAPELVAPAGQVSPAGMVQLNVASPGMLSTTFTIAGMINPYRVTASARPLAESAGPKIAPVRRTVARAGTVTIPLKLNSAGKLLLKHKKKLTVSLRLNFIRKGGQKATPHSTANDHRASNVSQAGAEDSEASGLPVVTR